MWEDKLDIVENLLYVDMTLPYLYVHFLLHLPCYIIHTSPVLSYSTWYESGTPFVCIRFLQLECYCDIKLLLWSERGLGSTGMLHSIDWWLVTDVSGWPVGSIIKDKAVQEDILVFLTLEDGTSRLSWNISNLLPISAVYIPEQQRS
jgi:hypothetical protein